MANDSKFRLLRILELLKTQTDENHPISTTDIETTLTTTYSLADLICRYRSTS